MKKKVWIFYATNTRPWGSVDFSSWTLMENGEPMTKEDAEEYLWESRCNACTHEPDMELCDTCEGMGCEDCDGTGGYYEDDWNDNVECHTYAGMAEYDPKEHFKVPSDRPEHLKWKSSEALKRAKNEETRLFNEVERLRRQLMEAGARHEASKHKLAEAELESNKYA